MSRAEARLRELGLELPPVPQPAACYVPWTREGNLVFISGQVPRRDGKMLFVGHVGRDLDLETAKKAAEYCALNCLAVLKAATGDLDRVKQILKVTGFVSSDPGFTQQPLVINGASELFVKVLGDRGRHARSAVGMAVLPGNAPTEVELIASVE